MASNAAAVADFAETQPGETAAALTAGANDDEPRKKRSIVGTLLRVLSFFVAGIALLLVLALGGLWIWSGTEGSLAQALQLAARFVPLKTEGVTGAIRGGGTIEQLRYDADGLKIEVDGAELKWQPAALLDKTVKLSRLAARRVKVKDQRAPTPAEPSTGPPQSLKLPVKIEVDQFALGRFEWAGPPPLDVTNIAGSYAYNGEQHQLTVASTEVMGGSYSAKATLTDQAPIRLDAQLNGQLKQDVPGGGAQGVALSLNASANGPLTDLNVKADAQAKVPDATDPNPPRATVSAKVTPWAAQPVPKADATFSDFDAGAIWAAAPKTQLTGELHVAPTKPAATAGSAAGWHLEADIDNKAAGPWDKKRLPLQQLRAVGDWQDGTAVIEELEARLGGGTLRAQGKYVLPATPAADTSTTASPAASAAAAAASNAPIASSSKPAANGSAAVAAIPAGSTDTGDWRVEAKLNNINPAELVSSLAAVPIDGTATVKSDGSAIDFDVKLRPDETSGPRRNATNGNAASRQLTDQLRQLGLRDASVNGRWDNGRLILSALQVRTEDAKLTGALDVQTAGPGGQGKLNLTAPGLDVSVDGELRENSGGGTANIAANDVGKLLNWAKGLPGVPDSVKQTNASGRATVVAKWMGGWRDPSVDLKIDAPKLDYVPPATADSGSSKSTKTSAAAKDTADQIIKLRDFQANASGKLSNLDLKAKGRAELGVRKLDLDLQASVGRIGSASKPLAESSWAGKIGKLEASVVDPAIGKEPWRLSLKNDVGFKWQPTAAGGAFEAAAGKLVVMAPKGARAAASQATIEWDPVRWREGELTTKGKLSGVPMAWAELATGGKLAGGRVSGDMVFNGDWDVSLGKKFDVKANLYRASGDLNIVTDPETGTQVTAGVKEARLSVRSNSSGDLNLNLNWQTDRAGQVNGEISTKLTKSGPDGGWTLAKDAPLGGNLKVSLPKLGVWSRLAPPGWRLDGGIDTDVRMGGTLADPKLTGTITADDLALRSIVDGFEFTGGKLRAKVNGQKLLIDEFTLNGAGGPNTGGTITASGSAELVDGKPQAKLTATIDHLRPSIRTDAEIALSGKIEAALAGQVASVTGALKVDRARIELPEDSAPTLGSDVVVQRGGMIATGAKAAEKTTPVAKATPQAAAAAKDSAAVSTKGKQVIKLNVKIDLGNDFRVSGLGLDSGLEGQLAIVGESLADPRVTGTIRTVEGRFRAYGQKLDITRGVIRFTGKPTNPSLDILALRANMQFTDVQVGVQITGNALLPQVALYSEPDMPDNEKLSWLV
ncbi:MAG: translocation/assembly module TamB domain-containing protein, partial [Burkholderiales bacterium]